MYMAKTISLFNNKGGVSKTTTTFHLGWKLAEKGYKTLIVDTDPQCNLTGLCINADKENKLLIFIRATMIILKTLFLLCFLGSLNHSKQQHVFNLMQIKNLFLLPGHIDFSEYDATYSVAENLTGSLALFQNVPGALRKLLELTGNRYNIDYILIDMSPSISATNANI